MGRDAAMHFDYFWREMTKSQGSMAHEHSLSLITGEDHPMGNFSILRESQDTQIIETAIRPIKDLAAPSAVLFVAGVSAAIEQRLVGLGYAKIDPMHAMAIDIAALAPTQRPDGCDFVRLSSAVEGTQWAEIVARGFSLPQRLARILSPKAHPISAEPQASIQYYGARRNGRVVATSMLYLSNGLAGLYCIATAPEERRRGLGAYVTSETLKTAYTLGYRVGVLQSSEAGHSVYRSLGFQDVDSVPMFIRMPKRPAPI